MRRFVCPVCSFSGDLHNLFLSNDLVHWYLERDEKVAFERSCQCPDTSLGQGFYGCPAMRETLNPRLCSRPSRRPVSAAHAPTSPLHAEPASRLRNMRDIMEQFHSLGDNCELGLVQRWAETEPLDLLRFAGFLIPIEHRLEQTIKALTDGFSGIGDPDSIVCELRGETYPREFMIHENRWQLLSHSGCAEGTVAPEELRLKQAKSFQFRRRKLLEDLEAAHRVFVWKSNLPTAESDVRRLVACLRSYGPNLLLWVSAADPDHPAGLVEYAGNGLLKGYVARFAPYEAAGNIDFTSWHAVCRNAAAAADFLRRCGEWSRPDLARQDTMGLKAPLEELSLAEAASGLRWEERKSEAVATGPVCIGSTSFEPKDKAWFKQNPGSLDVRSALLDDVAMETTYALLIKQGRKIRETRYLVDSPEEYESIDVNPTGLRFVHTDKVAVIGFNRAFRNYYHWMSQSLPAIDLSIAAVGADRCALALPPLMPWQEETLIMLGHAALPRIVIDQNHQHYFAEAHYCEYLNGQASFFLSPRVLSVFDKLADQVEVRPGSPELLYVARLDTPNRSVTNEKAIQALAETYGFVSVVPGDLPIREQIRLFRNARFVFGPHGAGLTNIAFCKPGTKVLELIQSSYANSCMNRIAQARQLDYHAECFGSIQNADVHKQSWTVDIERLAAKLAACL